MATERI